LVDNLLKDELNLIKVAGGITLGGFKTLQGFIKLQGFTTLAQPFMSYFHLIIKTS